MMTNNGKKQGIKSYVWLLMAVFCIVFSSASKRMIEIKVNPASYPTSAAFIKKIKDGSRDKREFLNKVIHADHLQTPDGVFSNLFLLSALISFAVSFLLTGIAREDDAMSPNKANPAVALLYLRHHRLQV